MRRVSYWIEPGSSDCQLRPEPWAELGVDVSLLKRAGLSSVLLGVALWLLLDDPEEEMLLWGILSASPFADAVSWLTGWLVG